MLSSLLDALQPWASSLLVLVQGLLTLVIWMVRKSFVTHDDLAVERSARGALEDRVTHVEHEIRQFPSRDDLHVLGMEMEKLRGDMREWRAEARGAREIFEQGLRRADDLVTRTERTVQMITEHLLRQPSSPV